MLNDEILEEVVLKARYAILSQIIENANTSNLLDWKNKGTLRGLLPEVAALDGVTKPEDYHPEGDVLTHTLIMLKLAPPCRMLRWAALLHDIGKPSTRTVDLDGRIRFNGHAKIGAELSRGILSQATKEKILSAEEAWRIERLIAGHMRWHNIRLMRRDNLLKWMKEPQFTCELELHRLDCMGSNGDLNNYEFALKTYQDIFGATAICCKGNCPKSCAI